MHDSSEIQHDPAVELSAYLSFEDGVDFGERRLCCTLRQRSGNILRSRLDGVSDELLFLKEHLICIKDIGFKSCKSFSLTERMSNDKSKSGNDIDIFVYGS